MAAVGGTVLLQFSFPTRAPAFRHHLKRQEKDPPTIYATAQQAEHKLAWRSLQAQPASLGKGPVERRSGTFSSELGSPTANLGEGSFMLLGWDPSSTVAVEEFTYFSAATSIEGAAFSNSPCSTGTWYKKAPTAHPETLSAEK